LKPMPRRREAPGIAKSEFRNPKADLPASTAIRRGDRKKPFLVRYDDARSDVTSIMRSHRFIGSTGAVALWLLGSFTSVARAQHFSPVLPIPQNVVVPGEGDSVPMLDFGGRPVIEVKINGKGPYQFIFDTGASFNVFDSSLAAELSLKDAPTIKELQVG